MPSLGVTTLIGEDLVGFTYETETWDIVNKLQEKWPKIELTVSMPLDITNKVEYINNNETIKLKKD